MNEQRRKVIEEIKLAVEAHVFTLEMLRDEERDTFDNMPENLQGSERGQACEQAADALDEACSSLDELISNLDQAIEG